MRLSEDKGFFDSAGWGIILFVTYLILALLPAAMALAYAPTGQNFLRQLGLGAALIGFSLLCLQFILSARIRLLDRPFGLDAVMRFHKGMAILAGVLLLCHPFLLAAGARSWSLFSLQMPWRIRFGQITLVLLISIIVFSLSFHKLRIDYQVWRVLHKSAVFIILAAFIHSYLIGSDLRFTGLRIYWWMLFVAANLCFLYRNAYVPLFGRIKGRVVAVHQENHNTYTIALEPNNGKKFFHRPGQFWFLKLKRRGRPSEEHPFTISSSPTRALPITSTIKESGNYTNTIGQTKVGDRAEVEGPFGRFTFMTHEPTRMVFIAGGIGITPFLSMLRFLQDSEKQLPIKLIWGNDSEADILCKSELDNLPDNVEITYVLKNPPANWHGESGYVTRDLLEKCAGDDLQKGADIYLCGPPAMMKKVIQYLHALGVDNKRIHFERFSI